MHSVAKNGANIVRSLKVFLSLIPKSEVMPDFSQVAENIAADFNLLAEATDPSNDDEEELSKRRNNLRDKLSVLNSQNNDTNRRIIIFIDDLDRLTDDEIIEMVKAVKAIGDLPNVVYVLLFDWKAVAHALDKVVHGDGDQYLDKIIQVPLQLPEQDKAVVLEKLRQAITRISGYEFDGTKSNSDRDEAVFNNCVRPFVSTIRDMHRLVNEFGFRYTVLKSDVEIMDLVGITSLEVFAPKIYEWISVRRRQLALGMKLDMFIGELNDEKTGFLQVEIDAAKALFPYLTSVNYEGIQVGLSSICLPAHVDVYFKMSLMDGVLHEADFKDLILHEDLALAPIDEQHIRVVSNFEFPRKATRYLKEKERSTTG